LNKHNGDDTPQKNHHGHLGPPFHPNPKKTKTSLIFTTGISHLLALFMPSQTRLSQAQRCGEDVLDM
jgi:hypothetical protein